MSELKIEINVNSVSKAEKTLKSFFDTTEQGTDKAEKSVKELDTALASLNKGLSSLNKGAISASEFSIRYAGALSTVRKQARSSAEANNDLVKKLLEVDTTLKRVRSSGKSLSPLAGIFKTIKAAAVGYATVLATMEISEFVKSTLTAGVALDSLERSYKAITGSSIAAGEELQYVTNIASTMGLELTSLEKSYKDILAASKNTTLEGQGVRDVFTAISKASTVLGMTVDETQGALRALSQMISKSNVQAEELIKSVTYKVRKFLLAPYTAMYSAKVS